MTERCIASGMDHHGNSVSLNFVTDVSSECTQGFKCFKRQEEPEDLCKVRHDCTQLILVRCLHFTKNAVK